MKVSISNCQLAIAKKGFTLIELMAAVAIILILASIMIPNVVKNVERGRKAKALADIDTLIKAVNLFQVDNGEVPDKLGKLWDATGQGPYISSDKDILTDNPWHGRYEIESGATSYTITAYDANDKEKVSKEITFGSLTQ